MHVPRHQRGQGHWPAMCARNQIAPDTGLCARDMEGLDAQPVPQLLSLVGTLGWSSTLYGKNCKADSDGNWAAGDSD